jgi:hypothetical protein
MVFSASSTLGTECRGRLDLCIGCRGVLALIFGGTKSGLGCSSLGVEILVAAPLGAGGAGLGHPGIFSIVPKLSSICAHSLVLACTEMGSKDHQTSPLSFRESMGPGEGLSGRDGGWGLSGEEMKCLGTVGRLSSPSFSTSLKRLARGVNETRESRASTNDSSSSSESGMVLPIGCLDGVALGV